jgi:type VI secretion system ImpB/VipA family protein
MRYDVSFGQIGKANRAVPGAAFWLALLGDFSGRASSGVLETGANLAARKPLKVDVDNLDTLPERLKVTVSVPLTEDGAVVSVPIKSIDDFHPDQLVENLPVLRDLLQLRRDLQSRGGFERAAKQVLSWSGETALPRPSRRSRGSAITTDRKISDFARLTGRAPTIEAAPDALIRRLVGPFIVPARDSRQDALVARVDAALSDAMRRVLHHPDFQTAEAVWRSLEFLVRRVETGTRLQIAIYDISAEELAADLAAGDRLDETGLYSLLVEQPAMDGNQGPLSVLAGLYQFEVTPPHADLLGRIAQVAAAAGAPFVAGTGPDILKTPAKDWHPLITQAWEALRALPAAAYLGLAAPRFLLRMPYGRKTEPIDSFDFEEFTRQAGLSGMLWGHAAVLAAYLLAETWLRDSKSMKIGSIATIGDLPVYVYHDTDGDQIALPCTERLFSERQAVQVANIGINPVLSLRGRPEVRMGGFASLAGGTLAGRWAPVDVTPPPPTPPPAPTATPPAAAATAVPPPAAPRPETAPPPPAEEVFAASVEPAPEANELDSLLAGLEASAPTEAAPETAPEPAADELDALLASLNAAPPAAEPADTESDLDALLASLK